MGGLCQSGVLGSAGWLGRQSSAISRIPSYRALDSVLTFRVIFSGYFGVVGTVARDTGRANPGLYFVEPSVNYLPASAERSLLDLLVRGREAYMT